MKILDSIEKTERELNDLLKACAEYRAAIIEKDFTKARHAQDVFVSYTERHWFNLSVEPPLHDEDALAEIFGEELVFGSETIEQI